MNVDRIIKRASFYYYLTKRTLSFPKRRVDDSEWGFLVEGGLMQVKGGVYRLTEKGEKRKREILGRGEE